MREYLQRTFPPEGFYCGPSNERFRRQLYDIYLGGLDMDKFPRLFKRAIPFRMNIKLEDFVKEYICMEQDIQIEDLQESVMQYGRMQSTGRWKPARTRLTGWKNSGWKQRSRNAGISRWGARGRSANRKRLRNSWNHRPESYRRSMRILFSGSPTADMPIWSQNWLALMRRLRGWGPARHAGGRQPTASKSGSSRM